MAITHETGRSPYDAILFALKKADLSKGRISEITGIPYGPLGHALEVLTLGGEVKRHALRYSITDKGRRALMGK